VLDKGEGMEPDRARFETMFRCHYAAVVRYAVRRVGRDAADEIVNETFLVAWRRLDDVPENALPWLFGTARKVVANEIRRRDRQRRLGERVTSEGENATGDHADAVTDALRVRAAMDALSDRDREVLRLSAWEQLDPPDGARALECTVAAYKVRLHRARRRLARLLSVADGRLDQLIAQGERHDG
jgi:RNA polymerase sigma factor (sigma-70 family)